MRAIYLLQSFLALSSRTGKSEMYENDPNNKSSMSMPVVAGDERFLLPGSTSSSSSAESDVTQVHLDGGPVSLDQLGPMIVNKDGTLRRISNWEQLSPAEKEATWRIVTKRNRERLQKLNDDKIEESIKT